MKPHVFIIGDSISMGYTPPVARLLAGRADVTRSDGAGDSDFVLAHLDDWLSGIRPAAIHFNSGLHDIKVSRRTRRNQVPLERYGRNLERILDRLARTGATLIWASTTPVIETRHQAAKDFDRYNRDVDAYNPAAREVMSQARMGIDDLHAAASAADLQAILTADGVHFTEEGYRLLAERVAATIRPML